MTEDQILLEEDPDGRVVISARIKRKGLAAIDWLAEQDGCDRSEEIRRLLMEAVLARKRLTAARQLGGMKRENAQNRR